MSDSFTKQSISIISIGSSEARGKGLWADEIGIVWAHAWGIGVVRISQSGNTERLHVSHGPISDSENVSQTQR